MINENHEYMQPRNNMATILIGTLVGGLAGAVTMLLLAPQSGRKTRKQIRKKGIELRDRTTEMVEDGMAQVRSGAAKIKNGGRGKAKELKQQGQDMLVEQLDHVSEAVQAGKKKIRRS